MRLARAPCLLRDSLHGGFTCVLLVILNQFLQFFLFLVSHNPRLSPAYPPHSRRIFTALFCEPSELRRVLEKVNYAKISPRAQRHLSLYLSPFSLFSSMFSPRQSVPCATWNIPASKSTRSTRPLNLKIAVEQYPSCFFCRKERKEHKGGMFLLIIHAVRSVRRFTRLVKTQNRG